MKTILTAALIVLTTCAFGGDTTRYEVITSGKVSGKHLKWTEPGSVGFYFEFNDRGRGPGITVDLKVNADGIVTSRKATGFDYYKATVEELYSNDNGNVEWKNKIENEKKTVTPKVIYSPINVVPGEQEIFLKALLKAQGHQLDVLPAGKLKATHVKNHSTKLDGLVIELELYSFTGLGGPPVYYWFTPRKEFFASISGWFTTIMAGHADLIPELKQLQDEIEEEYFIVQGKRLTEVPTEAVAIKNVNVLDVVNGKMIKGQTVMFEKGVITVIGKAKKVKVPATATIIDGANKTLMPGLWDNHAHYDISQGLFHLAGGVTNVKDMGNSLDLPSNKKKVDDGTILGPDITIMSGFIDFAGPYAGPAGKLISTLDEGLAAVDYFATNGYQQVKLYSSIPVDWVKPLADRAHEKGLKVVGHIPSFMTAERAVRDGYDQIIHLNMIMLNFMGDSLDTRSMGRFIKVGERAKNINLAGADVSRFIALLKEKKVVVDPTAAVFEEMFVAEPGKLRAGYEQVAGFFPTEFRRGLYGGGLPTRAGKESDYQQSFSNMLGMLKLLHQNGIVVVPGTDGIPGFDLHREFELYSQAGMSNADILRAATYTSAQVAGVDKELGTIAVGKVANIILVDGDPLKNISDIRKVELTVKRGNLFEPRALYASYGFSYWK